MLTSMIVVRIEVPPDVYKMLDTVGTDEKWWEVVELQKLILAHNNITVLSEDLGKITSLTLLNVSHNQLTSLPAAISELSLLKVIDISHNKIAELPSEIGAVVSLTRLHCASNLMASLPPSLGNLKNLVELKVPNNSLTELPEELCQCSRLTVLDLEGNKLTQIPDNILGNFSNLTELNASKNFLKGIPSDVGQLKKLIRLDVHQNRITDVPPSLAGCTGLIELFLGDNNLTSIPVEMKSLGALSTLDLHANQLKELPKELCELQLSVLDVSNNNLSGLPAELGNMSSLRKLVLVGNPLRSLRSTLVSGPTPALLKFLRSRLQDEESEAKMSAPVSGNIFVTDVPDQVVYAARQAAATKVLSLSGKSLASVPQAAWESDSLTSLDLSRNQIKDLPSELSNCTSLEVLLVPDNKIEEWPAQTLASLPRLRQLVLARNPLRNIPSGAFGSVEKLKILDLSGISGQLPPAPAFSLMPLLEELRLSRLRLREIPSDIPEMLGLRILDLSENSLTTVPETLSQLTKLEELDLANNNITTLSPKLGLLEPTMRSLKLEGNPLRRQVVDRSIDLQTTFCNMKPQTVKRTNSEPVKAPAIANLKDPNSLPPSCFRSSSAEKRIFEVRRVFAAAVKGGEIVKIAFRRRCSFARSIWGAMDLLRVATGLTTRAAMGFELAESTRLGFIGAGQMAEAIARGLVNKGVIPAHRITTSDISPSRQKVFQGFGVSVQPSNADVAANSDVLIVAVKPQYVPVVLSDASSQLTKNHLVVSIAAGVALKDLEVLPWFHLFSSIDFSLFSDELLSLVRYHSGRNWTCNCRLAKCGDTEMSQPDLTRRADLNSALLLVSVVEFRRSLSPGTLATTEDVELVKGLFSALGQIHVVKESLLNAVTGLSGSGPAYVFIAIEALADGGVAAGLPRDVARSLAAQTVLGAAKMVIETGKHPGQLKDEVASPAGTTIAGIHELEKAGFRAALMNAVIAATKRGDEMSG
ncbi:hypothetical protein AXG93_2960s1330 [Marchantia polymorpha subsp. ruderalis]|uniref:Pyrroline-5-carboxylate reductase n=1 Tax=Marchantia polymorpha subsp. ruderalis TaxID=1480154 RepID=A0A176W7J1_MARPO|nr:hypothetical protein AXG93_2960s1330 [Marchantia polymorpha subsp. ruderalis]